MLNIAQRYSTDLFFVKTMDVWLGQTDLPILVGDLEARSPGLHLLPVPFFEDYTQCHVSISVKNHHPYQGESRPTTSRATIACYQYR
jgi:hypothetical protein